MNLPDGYFLQDKKYQLTHAIGQGGFGITYLGVWDTEVKGELGAMKTKVPVCVKEYFFKDYCYRDKESYAVNVHSETGEKLFDKFKEKLIKEAKILSEVHHPYIVNVLEVFEENNTAYIIMEYIKGCSLKYMLDEEGVLPENKVLKYIHQIGNALDFVHNKNIVHLDIKPSNILIGRDDNARLIDFGVSKRYDIEEQETSTTTLTLSKGFASIEQYDDEGTQSFSPCPDIYSLGATMYNLLTGVIPIESILRATKTMLPPSSYNSNLTQKTEEAILKAMEVKPENRFQLMKEMLASIDVPPYEITENILVDTKHTIESDHTEVLGTTSSASANGGDEDCTIFTPSPGQNSVGSATSSKKKNIRRVLLTVIIFIFAILGYAVYDYISGFRVGDLDMLGSVTDTEGGEDDTPSDMEPLVSTPSDSVFLQSDGQLGLGQPVSDKPTVDNARPQTKPESVSNSSNNMEAMPSMRNVEPAVNNEIKYTQEEKVVFEKEYQDYMLSAKAKMRDSKYLEAREESLEKALVLVKTAGVGRLDEVEFFIQACIEREEEQKRKERLDRYEAFYTLGELRIVRDRNTGLYGAIDITGIERIECKYKMVDSHADGRAFLREDGRHDIYDSNGEYLGAVRLSGD